MRFGPVAPAAAEGAILAHSLTLPGGRLRKGSALSAADIAKIRAAGIDEITVARLEPEDIGEDAAAARLAAAIAPDPASLGLEISAPFTGRVNVFTRAAGVLRVDAASVAAFNAVDPAITLATLPDWTRTQARQMVATCKIIPYAAPGKSVGAAEGALGAGPALRLHAFGARAVAIILTRTPGLPDKVLAKGAEVVEARLTALGMAAAGPVAVVAHDLQAIGAALRAASGDMTVILGGSATSDLQDTCPRALVEVGGRIERFGMPVDPGNLLFLGDFHGRPVVGLPGCARSPALNGADWVLERLAAGLTVTSADIAAMGVGGLLKEIPLRPQPRAGRATARPQGRPRVAAIVLAAGASRRMRGADKLLETVEGAPVLRRVVQAALSSVADETLVVLPPDAGARAQALDGLAARQVIAAECAEGMAASLRAGLAAASERVDAAVVMLADMPEVTAGSVDRLIAAYDLGEGREICRAVSADGRPGHPVLFGRRFFENLASLRGDRGAREVLAEAADFVVDVPTEGLAAVIDLDTPEDWAAWRAAAV